MFNKYNDDFSDSEFENMRQYSPKRQRKKVEKKNSKSKTSKQSVLGSSKATKFLTAMLIVLVLGVIIGGVVLVGVKQQETTPVETVVPTSTPVVATPTPTPTPTPEPTLDTTGYDTTSFDSLTVVVNKKHQLTASDIPSNQVFVSMPATIEKMTIREDANTALSELYAAASEAGIDLYVNEAYVSYYYQQDLYNAYANSSSTSAADMVVPRSGYSEHQTGLAVDFISKENGKYTQVINSNRDACVPETCDQSQAALWLQEHAWEYGWIQRYPEGKESITGYYGQWYHYRYVGKELAAYMHEYNYCLEEALNVEGGEYN